LVGINQLLDDQSEGEAGGTPTNCEPITRQFLRIFKGAAEVKRDQIQKYLRGTGIGPSDFISRGWTAEKKKIFHWLSPLEFAKERAEKLKSLTRDMDQAMILVGACYENSGIEVKKLLNSEFKPHPALGDLLQWLCGHGADKEMRQNAMTARQLYSTWSANNQQIVKAQLALFDMEDEA
jgi:putative DNA methylase